MKWTGLTGGIATGKSTAARLIESLGVPVIDADQVSHRLSEPGQPAYLQIRSHFGNELFKDDSTLDRKKLGQLIFADPRRKSELEAILHPLIKEEVRKLRQSLAEKNTPLAFYDVPLLFEKDLVSQFDRTVLVWCDDRTQLQRLMQRNSLTEEEAELRRRNQWPLIEKVKRADHCIDNSGDPEDLKRQLVRLLQKLI